MNAARTILELFLEPADRVLAALPLGTAKVAALLLLVLPVLLCMLLSKASIFRGAPRQSWTRDLRLWAALFTVPYALVYFFGG